MYPYLPSSGFIAISVDLASYNDFLAIPLLKRIACAHSLDVICVLNTPSYLESFSSDFGLREFLRQKYGLVFPKQIDDCHEITKIINNVINMDFNKDIKSFLTSLRDLILTYATGIDEVDLLEVFNLFHIGTMITLARNLWETTKIDEGTPCMRVPILYLSRGGVHERGTSNNFTFVTDTLFTFKEWLTYKTPRIFHNLSDILYLCKHKRGYLILNKHAPFFRNDMFREIDVKYVTTNVTNDERFDNKYFELLESMTCRNIPIHMALQESNLCYSTAAQFWDAFSKCLDKHSWTFESVRKSIMQYFDQTQVSFDITSAILLLYHITSIQKKAEAHKNTHTLLASPEYGYTYYLPHKYDTIASNTLVQIPIASITKLKLSLIHI